MYENETFLKFLTMLINSYGLLKTLVINVIKYNEILCPTENVPTQKAIMKILNKWPENLMNLNL